MKCLVCNTEYNGDECPVCEFPVVELFGDYEEGIKSIKPAIDSYRNEFVKKIIVGLVAYNYTIDNHGINETSTEEIEFGCISDLINKTQWSEEEFEIISARDRIPVTVYRKMNNRVTKQNIIEFQCDETGTFQVGIGVNDELEYHMLLKDSGGRIIESSQYSVFNV